VTIRGPFAGVAAAAALLAVVVPGTAAAHAYPVGSIPAAGTSVGGSPRTITLEFDEPVSAPLSRVAVVGARTGAVGPVSVRAAGPSTLVVTVPRLGRDLYRVEWDTVAQDDFHPTGGTLVFGVRTTVPGSAPLGQASGPSVSRLEVALRWADFVLVSALVGALAMLLYVLPRSERIAHRSLPAARVAAARLATGSSLAALVTGFGLVVVQVDQAGGWHLAGAVIAQTTYGRAFVARQLALVAVALILLALRRRSDRRPLRVGAAALAIGLVASLAVTSHAAGIEGAASPATAALAIHLLAACIWAGGLIALAVVTIALARAGDGHRVGLVASGFGGPALVSVAALVISGIGVLGIHVRSLDALVHTGYGRTLIVKTGLFVLAGAIGLISVFTLRARSSAPGVPLVAAWAQRLECGVLLAVLAAAAVLTARSPARAIPVPSASAIGQAPTAAWSSALAVGDLVVDLDVEPNRPGVNFVTVRVFNTRRPAPAPVRRISLALQTSAGSARHVVLRAAGRDEWQTVTRLSPATARLAVSVGRPGLGETTAGFRWRPTRPAALPPAPSRSAPTGLAERRLAPVLEPIAIGGGVLLVAVLLAFWIRSSAPRPRLGPGVPTCELTPRQVER
jgi:copper transport protein